jgi:hypothetical protein
MTMTTDEHLKAGEYVLLLPCPDCAMTVHFPIDLSGRLVVDKNGSSLRPVLTAKSRDHACGADPEQLPLPYLQPQQ